jgi:uncharacterized protein
MPEPQKTKWVNDKLFSTIGDGPVLIGSKCRSCGKIHFPQKTFCDQCFHRFEMDIIPLSREGKLITYTVMPKYPKSKDLYASGFVDLPKEKLIFFTMLTDCEPFDKVLKVGMDLELVFEKLMTDKEGVDIMGYKFRPKK